jgi:transposase
MTDGEQLVVGGVDTHKDVHVAAVIDGIGRIVATSSFPTTRLGERALCRWMRSQGRLERVGVEGTGTYGAGLCRYLESEGVTVVEVNRPNRQMRRRRGKSDTVDAEAAARAVLNGEATVVPKDRTGVVESIRMVRVAFCSAREARTKVANQIRDLVLTAPADLRAQLGGLTTAERVKRCARLIPGDGLDATNGAKVALRHLARRYQSLTEEMDELHAQLDRLTADANPALRSAKGVGVDVASILLVAAGENPERLKSDAAFSAMCGVSPVPASSGKIQRHRLNRSGNRQANHALWRIAMVRLVHDDRTRDYVERRMKEGRSKREALRCLKRYIAREIYALLVRPGVAVRGAELRAERVTSGRTLADAASALGTWPIALSRLERGLTYDGELAARYRAWLEAS